MEEFSFVVKRKDPKPNAPEYHIETIEQLFEMLTDENYQRWLKDFRQTIELKLSLDKTMKLIAESEKVETGVHPLKVKTYTWVDDEKQGGK